MANNPHTIRQHESGADHKKSVEKSNESYLKAKKQTTSEERRNRDIMATIEQAAQANYERDLRGEINTYTGEQFIMMNTPVAQPPPLPQQQQQRSQHRTSQPQQRPQQRNPHHNVPPPPPVSITPAPTEDHSQTSVEKETTPQPTTQHVDLSLYEPNRPKTEDMTTYTTQSSDTKKGTSYKTSVTITCECIRIS